MFLGYFRIAKDFFTFKFMEGLWKVPEATEFRAILNFCSPNTVNRHFTKCKFHNSWSFDALPQKILPEPGTYSAYIEQMKTSRPVTGIFGNQNAVPSHGF